MFLDGTQTKQNYIIFVNHSIVECGCKGEVIKKKIKSGGSGYGEGLDRQQQHHFGQYLQCNTVSEAGGTGENP